MIEPYFTPLKIADRGKLWYTTVVNDEIFDLTGGIYIARNILIYAELVPLEFIYNNISSLMVLPANMSFIDSNDGFAIETIQFLVPAGTKLYFLARTY